MLYLCIANEKGITNIQFSYYRGVEQLVARQAHNLEVACSSLAPATIYNFSFWCLSYITYNSNTFFIYNIYLSYSFLGGSTKKNSCASLAQ